MPEPDSPGAAFDPQSDIIDVVLSIETALPLMATPELHRLADALAYLAGEAQLVLAARPGYTPSAGR